MHYLYQNNCFNYHWHKSFAGAFGAYENHTKKLHNVKIGSIEPSTQMKIQFSLKVLGSPS